MRLAVTILGREFLVIDFGEPAYEDIHDDEPGDCVSFPVGFVASHEIPDGSGYPYREGWE